ncbi:hypothetical protein Y1Q_0013844 [Alligator mississippiensis]|uniref:Uncharacterized protein n=1 Tax=Alligator mississippiensis TaxID=8496 RepID=A0A151NFS5_ALLMI|nr:hypothetical protein Y1Q_0013844 [Alligator mississippiensis]
MSSKDFFSQRSKNGLMMTSLPGEREKSFLSPRWGDLGCMELDTLGGGDAIETCDNPAHLLVMLIAVVPGFLLDPGSRPYRPCLSRCPWQVESLVNEGDQAGTGAVPKPGVVAVGCF